MQSATGFLPAAVACGTRFTERDTGPGGMYDLLEESVGARMPTPAEAGRLGLPKDIPLLRIVRMTTGPDGSVLEVNDTRVSAEAFEVGCAQSARGDEPVAVQVYGPKPGPAKMARARLAGSHRFSAGIHGMRPVLRRKSRWKRSASEPLSAAVEFHGRRQRAPSIATLRPCDLATSRPRDLATSRPREH